MIYTREIHIKRLQGMLKKKDPCMYCPAGRYYGPYEDDNMEWENNYCKICLNFIGINKDEWLCPCILMDKEDAIKQTLLALEKYHEISN